MDLKVPTNKAEMDELRKSLVEEITDDELDDVAGGNDDLQGKFSETIDWTCPFCGNVLKLKQYQDGPKHIVKCPNNPYK